MLDQLIYTRCMPHRELKNKGRVTLSDGFGVFSVSRELFSNQRISSYDFLQARLAVPNGAKEEAPVGLISSYDYSMIAPEVYALSFEFARSKCMIPRANGYSHRSGTYIKQTLIGDIEGYPAEWFGSAVWDAHEKAENDYYMDLIPNPEPPFLPQVSSTPVNGLINVSTVRQFVSDGRADAVKAGLWFLMQEFNKPEGKRKVLLIKDTPENVAMWIAAIEYGFSASMARKITFATNRSKLGTQTDSVLFYYTDETGRFYPAMNHALALTRHPYSMITGYHPSDQFCAGIKQMPASNFVIIDGTAKTFGIQTDNSINRPYYSAVVQYDADIQDFCDVVLPSLPFRGLTGNLPDLFDAYKYLLDSNHKSGKWSYNATVQNFDILLQYGIPGSAALNRYLVDECIAGYGRFSVEDEHKGYPLLKYMWNIAKKIGAERDITGCMADIVSRKLNSLTNHSNGIADTWRAMRASGVVAVLQPAMRDLFNDTELAVYAEQFIKSDITSVETVVDMFFNTMADERISLASIGEESKKFSFLFLAALALFKDQTSLKGFMDRLNHCPELFNRISLAIAKYLEEHQPGSLASWWDMIMDICGGSVVELCRNLCESKNASIEMVEGLLANRMERAGKYDANLGKAFGAALVRLSRTPTAGTRFFGAWVKISQPYNFPDIMRTVRRVGLNREAEENIFRLMDSRMPYDRDKSISPAVYTELKQWGDSLKLVSVSAAFYEFKRQFEKEHRVEKALEQANAMAQMKFRVNREFLNSRYFADLAAISSEFCDAGLHVAMLCIVQGVDGKTMDSYVRKYTSEVLSVTKSRDMVRQLISLCTATMYRFQVPGRTPEFVSNIQRSLDAALSEQLAEHYKPNLADQISKCGNCDWKVQEKLVSQLRVIGESSGPKNISGWINSLFGRR